MASRGLNKKRAVRYMGVSGRTFDRWIKAGLLAPVEIGGIELYDVRTLDALFDAAVRSLGK